MIPFSLNERLGIKFNYHLTYFLFLNNCVYNIDSSYLTTAHCGVMSSPSAVCAVPFTLAVC